MPYLLDADWAIDALARRRRADAVLKHLAPEGIAISWVTIGEVYEGAYRSPNPQERIDAFREFLRPFRVLDLNDPIMERFAAIRAYLRGRGEVIPDLDLLLAATALHHDLTVLTRNLRHLERVPSLKLYGGGP